MAVKDAEAVKDPENTQPPVGTLTEALIKAAQEMPVLRKADRNAHGNYNFVSIDDYYATAAKVALNNGITWKAREVGFEIHPPNGVFKGIVISKYEFDVLWDDMEWQGFFACSIPHPIQGAQTAGSMLSYADKLFMRTVFKIQTGEQEADSTNGADMGVPLSRDHERADPRNREPAAAPVAGDPQAAYDLISGFIPMAKTEAELIIYWHSNTAAIEVVRLNDPALYDRLVRMFSTAKLELAREKK